MKPKLVELFKTQKSHFNEYNQCQFGGNCNKTIKIGMAYKKCHLFFQNMNNVINKYQFLNYVSKSDIS